MLKKRWFSDPELLEICGNINHEENTQREPLKRIKTLNFETVTVTELSITTSTLIQDWKNAVLEKNHEWTEDYITVPKISKLEKNKVETEKVNKLLKHTPTDSITELNELIYVEAKQVRDKIAKS